MRRDILAGCDFSRVTGVFPGVLSWEMKKGDVMSIFGSKHVSTSGHDECLRADACYHNTIAITNASRGGEFALLAHRFK